MANKFPKIPHQVGWKQCPNSGAIINTTPSQNKQRILDKKELEEHRKMTSVHQETISTLGKRIEALEKIISDFVKRKDK